MDWGRSLPMVIAVLVAYAALNASIGLLLGNLATTEAQAAAIGVLTSNLLAALGGCWWPIEISPRWMQSLSLLLPTGWAMDAMHKLTSFGLGAASAAPHVAIMAATALLVGTVAARTFRYQ
jgi:ABC-type multidrug transport system permease subunit